MINWDFFVKKDSRHSRFQTPMFSCFYYCLQERVGDEDGITYDMAVASAIDEDADFYACDGEWYDHWSDDGDFSDDEEVCVFNK